MSNRKRTGKFYNKNEKEVMELLGLKPTVASGAGWLEKEDGQNDHIICQLKSTDALSIRVKQEDIETLEYNATVTNKIPIFAIQFLNSRSDIDMGTYLLIRPSDLTQVVNYISQPYKPVANELQIDVDHSEDPEDIETITSSAKAKDQWKKEQEEKWKGRK